MDLQAVLEKLEADFLRRLNKHDLWGRNEIEMEFNNAVRNVLVTTYSRVMKDAKEKKDGAGGS